MKAICNNSTKYMMDTYNEYPYNQLFISGNGLVVSHDTYLEIQHKESLKNLSKRR